LVTFDTSECDVRRRHPHTFAAVSLSSPEGRMVEPERQVLCPSCHAVITVEPEWRLAECPKCHRMMTRMGEDSAYD
jgi:Zn finger protein HypA/HybF involved in hydrogenase expression